MVNSRGPSAWRGMPARLGLGLGTGFGSGLVSCQGRGRGRRGAARRRADLRRARPEIEALEALVVMNASNLVVSAAVVPQDLVSGQTINVRWDVMNRGTDAADASWSDSVYLSTDDTLDASDVLLGAAVPAPSTLAAGASYTQQKSFTVPADDSGDYYLIFKVDSGGAQAEADEDDNTRAVPVALDGTPADLVVTSATVPASAYVGQINISYTVANQGHSAASGVSQDQYYLSTTSTLDVSKATFVGSSYQFITINAGASQVMNPTVNLPASTAPGDYYLFIVANGYENIFESDNDNNTSAPQPITIKATSVDLQVTDANAPASAMAGDSVNVSWTVTNAGADPATASYWYDYIYLSTKDTLDSSATYLNNAYRSNPAQGLAGGDHYNQSQSITVPSVAAGDYYLLIQADTAGAGQIETDTGNNVRAVKIHVGVPDVDLQITDATAPATFNAGDSVPLTWTVVNNGDDTANTSYWYDYIYISTKNTYDSSAQYVNSFYHMNSPALTAGSNYTAKYSTAVPYSGTLAAGDYYLLFVANGGTGYQYETNTQNNTYAVKVHVNAPDVDLQPTGSTSPATAGAGDAISVSWTVTNNGADAADATSWYDYIYLSTNDTYDYFDTYLTSAGHDNSSQLAGGASYTQSTTVHLPDVAAGDYYLLFYPNQYSRQPETNTDNNVRAVAIQIGAGTADLDGDFSSAPTSAAAGQYVSATWAFTNQGQADAKANWSDTVYLSTNSDDDTSGDTALATISIGSQNPLEVGQGYVVSMDVFVPKATATGDYYLKFLANDDGGLGEDDTSNNLLTSAIHIDAPSTTPVSVEALQVNDGAAQRSMVNSLAITFSGQVTFDDGAFALKRSDGTSVGLSATSAVVNGQTVVTLTFSGNDTEGASLADGRYTLTIAASKIHGDQGQGLDADYVDQVFRLFGDTDGDGDVDNLDYFAFRSSAGKKTGDAGFLWYLDALGDGSVDIAGATSDYQKFLKNFRKVLA